MIENWDVAPWVFVTIGGPIVLGLAILVALMRRGRRGAREDGHVGRGRSPDYSDPSQNR
ncbi:hypothetical protein [uncultured Alsobacter sp.]|uniref:hypothetical protein n=1 Tax=uncultured Alsobacter sp. TaxID=1748258 RepID=UPI0025FE49AB|nr:hypothetical protein [uncultured Alsobacter sp.]